MSRPPPAPTKSKRTRHVLTSVNSPVGSPLPVMRLDRSPSRSPVYGSPTRSPNGYVSPIGAPMRRRQRHDIAEAVDAVTEAASYIAMDQSPFPVQNLYGSPIGTPMGTPEHSTYHQSASSPLIGDRTHLKTFLKVEDFHREYRNAQELHNIDPEQSHFIYGIPQDDEDIKNMQLSMPYGGKSMMYRLDPARPKLPQFKSVVRWLLHTAEAISILNTHHFIHQDIRLANIVTHRDTAKVIDFNIMVKIRGDDIVNKYKMSATVMEDIIKSPYYPPSYVKRFGTLENSADEFISNLQYFTCYGNLDEGKLLNFYLQLHGIRTEHILKTKAEEASTIKIDWKMIDGYSLGIVMMEAYLLMDMLLDSDSFYVEVMRGLTNFTNPMLIQEAIDKLRQLSEMHGGRRQKPNAK